MPFPAACDSYPGKDEVADYLQSYVSEFKLPVRLNTTVTRLSREDEVYLAETDGGPIQAQQVVVATGPFQAPFTPPMADQLDRDLTRHHSASYRRPDDVPGGTGPSGRRGELGAADRAGVLGFSTGGDLGRKEAPDAAADATRARHLVVVDADAAGKRAGLVPPGTATV